MDLCLKMINANLINSTDLELNTYYLMEVIRISSLELEDILEIECSLHK